MTDSIHQQFEEFDRLLSAYETSPISQYRDAIYAKVDVIADQIRASENYVELEKEFMQICQKFASGPMHQRARNQPLGYAGDYLLIDWIYTNKTAENGNAQLSDRLFQSYEAAQAVRNRKDYFIQKCLELSHSKNERIDVLNLASGPCRDVLETFEASDNGRNLHFHCIDQEPEAVDYAQKLLASSKAAENVHLEVQNVLRLRTDKTYDLIWSAGLFDYLEDSTIVLLLKRLWKYLKDDGQIIFGNFGPNNPTRKGMELVSRWYLIHRSVDELIELCKKAGIPFRELEIESEPLGINLFCVIKK